MMTDGKHDGIPQEGESDDALWRLLERAPRPRPVSPYFARRVLREVALGEARPVAGGISNWLARIWQAGRRAPGASFACALGAVVLLAAGGLGVSWTRWHPPVAPVAVARTEPTNPAEATAEPPVAPDASAENDLTPQPSVAVASEPAVTAQDVEVIADLDNLLSHEESRLWTEDDTARF